MKLDTNNTKGGLESYMKKVVSNLLSINSQYPFNSQYPWSHVSF